MKKPDHELLRNLIVKYGLYNVLVNMSRICSDHAMSIAPHDAHMSNEWMHRSVALDGLAVELEGAEVN